MSDPLSAVKRLFTAQNAGDVDGMVACFATDYRSEQPAHPARAFVGAEQVRKNWSLLLDSITGFRTELLDEAVTGDRAWVEFRWTGTRADGSAFEEVGVGIFSVLEGRIASARLYAEEVERDSSIHDAVARMAGRS